MAAFKCNFSIKTTPPVKHLFYSNLICCNACLPNAQQHHWWLQSFPPVVFAPILLPQHNKLSPPPSSQSVTPQAFDHLSPTQNAKITTHIRQKRQEKCKSCIVFKDELCLHRYNSMDTKPNDFIQTYNNWIFKQISKRDK